MQLTGVGLAVKAKTVSPLLAVVESLNLIKVAGRSTANLVWSSSCAQVRLHQFILYTTSSLLASNLFLSIHFEACDGYRFLVMGRVEMARFYPLLVCCDEPTGDRINDQRFQGGTRVYLSWKKTMRRYHTYITCRS